MKRREFSEAITFVVVVVLIALATYAGVTLGAWLVERDQQRVEYRRCP